MGELGEVISVLSPSLAKAPQCGMEMKLLGHVFVEVPKGGLCLLSNLVQKAVIQTA